MKSRTTSQLVIGIVIFIIVALVVTKCGTNNPFSDHSTNDRNDDLIDLDQNVTADAEPKDSLYANFTEFWPTLVSPLAELKLPVRRLDKNPDQDDDVSQVEPWNPRVSSNCIFSEESGLIAPEITLTWAEPVQNYRENPIRLDLTVHYQGFERDLYSSIFPIESLNRFNIPGNSEFLNDTPAILLTGMTLFPTLRNYSVETKPNQAAPSSQNTTQSVVNQEFALYSVTLKDLSPGLSYTISLCELLGKEVWEEERTFVFTTPICKNKF